jgi:hypothetical protein
MKRWGRKPVDVRKRFEAKIRRDVHGCHIWTGAKRFDGTGVLWVQPYLQEAARVAVALQRGWIDTGERAIPMCGNERCVNVKHLRCEYRTRLWRGKCYPQKIILDEAAYIRDELIIGRANR